MTATDFGRFLPRLILLVILLGGAGCDLQVDSAGASTRNAQVEHIDLDDEVRHVFPKGTVIYYANVYRDPTTHIDQWSIKSLDIHSGTIKTVLTDNDVGLTQTVPSSVTHDGRHLLVYARDPRTRRKVLLELDTQTEKWRKVADDIFYGVYSPDDTKIAVYYPLEPKRFHKTKNKSLRIGIIDRSGKFLNRIKCHSSRCLHPNWTEDGNGLLYIDETNPERLYLYHLKHKQKKVIYTTNSINHELSYPEQCNKRIHLTQEHKQGALLNKKNGETGVSLIIIDTNNSPSTTKSINLQRIIDYTCIPKVQDYLVATDEGDNNKYGTPTDMLHLVLLDLNTNRRFRLTLGPTLKSSSLGPVVYIPISHQ